MAFTVAQPPFVTNEKQEKKINSLFLHQNPSLWQRWGVTASAKVPSPPRSHRERSSDGWWPPRPPGGHNIAGEWQWCSGGFGYLLVWLMAAAVHPTRAQHVGWMGKMKWQSVFFSFFISLSFLSIKTCMDALFYYDYFSSNFTVLWFESQKDQVILYSEK